MVKILSLFDGMSCAQIAINKLGIKHYTYYASEIDKYAIEVTQKNYPNTIQLGDVKNIKGDGSVPLHLLIGGSPCQGFSFAGKQLNFDDPRSALFFEFLRIKNELKPKWFLLENVKMKKEYQDVISHYLGVQPIQINSSLVSAQNRVRLYWTNIPNIAQPIDKGIYLRDILESGATDRDKSLCIDANYFKGGSLKNYLEKRRRQLIFQVNPDKSAGGKQPRMQDRVYLDEGKSCALTAQFSDRINVGFKQSELRLSMVYDRIKNLGDREGVDEVKFRKLSVIECERLQTVPDNYTNYVSNSQRYKMLGNGFTVDVISHILSFTPEFGGYFAKR